MYQRFTEKQLQELFESQLRELTLSELNNNTIDKAVASMACIPRSKISDEMAMNLIREYEIVYLYLEALRDSGITNMLSGWVRALLKHQFYTLEDKDTLELVWASFGILHEEILLIPTSRAFKRNFPVLSTNFDMTQYNSI